MDEMIRFVMLAQSARFTVSELCEQFGISRKTGYKYLERYEADGLQGLGLRSHRPHQFPRLTWRLLAPGGWLAHILSLPV
jgi:predicted DNA-binding transcriptional regulator YafY